jgi:hypothetical protein
MVGRTSASLSVLVVGLLLVAGWARADAVNDPVISGTPQVGQALTATWSGDGEVTGWQWLRCSASSCADVPEAISMSYVVADADIGSQLRVRAIGVTDADGRADPVSAPTATIPMPDPPPSEPPPSEPPPSEPPPSEPPPSEPPPSEPSPFEPTPSPTPAPFTLAGPPSPRDVGRTTSRLPLLDPFPVVRIRGRLTATGARVTLLTVRATRGARITARCRGRTCPVRRVAVAAPTRLRAFERHLRANTRLEITVRKRDHIGKWTIIKIRRGSPPRRSDRCLYPGVRRPVRCPVS